MTAPWTEVPIASIALVARGGSPRPIKKFITTDADGVNWIKIGDTEKGGRYIYSTEERIRPDGIKRSRWVDEGDFLLSNSMSFGRPYVLKTSGCIHDGWLVLKPDYERVDQDYLYYALSSPAAFRQFDSLAAGSTVRNLNINIVSGVTIPLPPLEEQKRIVAVLDQAFAALDRARAHAEANLSDSSLLYERRRETLLNAAGDNWRSTTVGDVCERFEYGTSAKSQPEGRVPVLRMGNLQGGEVDWANLVYTDDSNDIDKLLLRRGDVLFNRTNSIEHVGKTAIYRGEQEAIFAGYLIRLHLKAHSADPEFMNVFLNSDTARGHGRSVMGKSVNQANISASKLKDYPLLLPPLDKQRSIVRSLRALGSAVSDLKNSYAEGLRDIANLRQSLLQKAFSGQLT
ncbi:restriction endonuclease subunit S [Jiella pelagia]|uniref:Restriction endonuclease subunit S n=1 Tax=Jiella pelagia TaxID=2986949 RepID=A0ABY7C2J7_9HYPH|nr:restriction endonuclease subunit S [Jiella pelagia]WAP69941.1 restriction endonuclease subunit S [Jiella pelagia]